MTTEAHRSLDAKVARKVMGWTIKTDLFAPDGPWVNTGEYLERLPEFSTDIAAAWEVLEKLVADGAVVQLHGYGGMWYAATDRAPGGTSHQFGETSAPLAIVRMALAAVKA